MPKRREREPLEIQEEERDERQRLRERYRIYLLPRGGGTSDLQCIATTRNKGWIGGTLIRLREEEQITHNSRVGLKDDVTNTWLINPFGKGD